MKWVNAIVCAAAGAASSFPAAASAAAVHCTAESGIDTTIVEGQTGCRAAGDVGGQVHSAGLDGVGYAGAALGSQALGVGVAGGVGASEGVEGTALAAGFDPDAVASSTGDHKADEPSEDGHASIGQVARSYQATNPTGRAQRGRTW